LGRRLVEQRPKAFQTNPVAMSANKECLNEERQDRLHQAKVGQLVLPLRLKNRQPGINQPASANPKEKRKRQWEPRRLVNNKGLTNY
jgi:hypothetical protein